MSSRLRALRRSFSRDTVRRPALSEPHPLAGWSRYYGKALDADDDRLRVQRFEQLTSATNLSWTDGLSIRLVPGEDLSRALFVSGTHEPNTLCVLRSLLVPGDVFFDVGAHAGVVSLAASRWVGITGSVFSFEPSEREYRRLVESLEMSAVANVVPVRLAVTDASGEGVLRVADARSSGLNTMGSGFAYSGVATDHIERVATVTLDDFVESQKLTRVAGVKIDAEGAEAASLAGASRLLAVMRPAVVLEVNARALEANGSSRREVQDLLHDAGYDVFAIDDSTARLVPLSSVEAIDEDNVVALPRERRNDHLGGSARHSR